MPFSNSPLTHMALTVNNEMLFQALKNYPDSLNFARFNRLNPNLGSDI